MRANEKRVASPHGDDEPASLELLLQADTRGRRDDSSRRHQRDDRKSGNQPFGHVVKRLHSDDQNSTGAPGQWSFFGEPALSGCQAC
jgi:hypothetical protein